MCTYTCGEVGLCVCAQGTWLFVLDVYRCNCTLATVTPVVQLVTSKRSDVGT